MSDSTVNSPYVLARTFVFRRYVTARHHLAGLRLTAEAIREARQRRRQERHDARMRIFYSWCETFRGLGFMF
ncbi:hypothetical protein [Hymenobacter lapidiphilus]|uniref:Uncharacterized protein n=1 Tax=Hymenobacter lapidiphilus TaxID=2608003 RepID=A0A7Y7PRM0_9BACT|nr:hypothetical protein [Hymenobacter lapidiphilus]NVO32769.1 hypothetical protein [Hymenobacter lapidiphilus]